MTSEIVNQIYFNNAGVLSAKGSEMMLHRLQSGEAIFFTVSIEDFKTLQSKAIEKDSGHFYRDCKAFFIPNSYLELHVSEHIGIFDTKVGVQVRKRADDRGINIFATKAKFDVTHSISLDTNEADKDVFFNELHLTTRFYTNPLSISVTPL